MMIIIYKKKTDKLNPKAVFIPQQQLRRS